jgi:prepilin-type N-terminal cleavage/methylation domain-containing protein
MEKIPGTTREHAAAPARTRPGSPSGAAIAARHGARGYTLLEIAINVAVVAIVAAIALPSYADYVVRSRIAEATSSLSDMRVRLEQYFADNRRYPTECIASAPGPAPSGKIHLPAGSRHFTGAGPGDDDERPGRERARQHLRRRHVQASRHLGAGEPVGARHPGRPARGECRTGGGDAVPGRAGLRIVRERAARRTARRRRSDSRWRAGWWRSPARPRPSARPTSAASFPSRARRPHGSGCNTRSCSSR